MKTHMKDSKRIGDAWLFTENSLKVLYGNYSLCFATSLAEISGVSQGVRPSQPDCIIRTNLSNCLLVLQVKCLKTGIFECISCSLSHLGS